MPSSEPERTSSSRSHWLLAGLVAAVGVGAIAGLIPALVAVRVKPIDAIRF